MKSDPHVSSSVADCKIIDLPRHYHRNGSLSVIEEGKTAPFDIKRVYYLYDVPSDSQRGGHSHIRTRQLLIAVSGSFVVNLDDGVHHKQVTLNKPYQGLLITEGIWRTLDNFSASSVCLVLASEPFDEADYVRDYDEFLKLTSCKQQPHYPFLDLSIVNDRYAQLLKNSAAGVIDSGRYIGGDEVAEFEKSLAALCESSYAIGVSNGLDALRLIFRGYIELGLLKEGDEVIVPANTFIASVLAITDSRLVPVFVDPDPDTCNLSGQIVMSHLTPRTRAVMPVHLYGRIAWDADMLRVAERGLLIIEDNAQAIGARSKSVGINGSFASGSLGHASAISFYPTKNLGALGDAGAVVTNDEKLASVIKALRNYGSEEQYYNTYRGLNCRLDSIQAAFLNAKLPYLKAENEHRHKLAQIYNQEIRNVHVKLPIFDETLQCVWHQYVVCVQDREGFRAFLKKNGVETGLHYPVPPHQQNCYKEYGKEAFPVAETLSSQVVSLPISSCTSCADAYEIAKIINSYDRQ